MSLPDGVTTCLLTYDGNIDTYGGVAESITLEVRADRVLVHAASGKTLFNREFSTTAPEGGVAQLNVPHTDQAGFRDIQGNAFVGWSYTATMTVRFGSDLFVQTKTFSVPTGQSVIDLDLLPSPGMVQPGVTAPTATVTSVLGLTGAVTEADLAGTFASPGLVRSRARNDGQTGAASVLFDEAAELFDGGSGHLVLPRGDILIDEQWLHAVEGAIGSDAPLARTLMVSGQGGYHSGQVQSQPDTGGTRLIMAYQGASYEDAKILTTGLGRILFQDIVFVFPDLDDETPFFKTTNTTPIFQRCAFIGRGTAETAGPDVLLLGGTKKPLADGYDDPDSAFQGYGGIVRDNYFSGIRRAVFGRSYANQVVVETNFVEKNCGSDLDLGACIEFNGNLDADETHPGDYCTGNVVAKNYLNGLGYQHQIKLVQATRCTIDANGSPDPQPDLISLVGCYAGEQDGDTYPSIDNSVVFNNCQDAVHLFEDTASEGRNLLLGGYQNEGSRFPDTVTFLDNLKIPNPVAQQFTISDLAGNVISAIGGAARAWAHFGAFRVLGKAGVAGSTLLEVGDGGTTNDDGATIQTRAATGKANAWETFIGAVRQWGFYDAGAAGLWFMRDYINSRMHATFTAGPSKWEALTEFNGVLKTLGPVVYPTVASGDRGSAALYGTGATVYDSTLHRLITFDGTGWQAGDVEGIAKSDLRTTVVVADSLGSGQQDGVGYNWPEQLKTALGAGVSVVNQSNPAWTSTELAVFAGARDLTLAAFTIPATVTPVTFTITAPTGDWSPPGGNGTYTWLGEINGIPGLVKRTTSGSGTWTFTRLLAGASTPVTAGSTFHCTINDTTRDGTALIMVGRNNTANLATVMADTAAIVARLSPTVKRYLVVSCLSASNETSGSAGYGYVTALNAALTAAYGDRYVDARRFMIDQGLAFNSLTAAGPDTTAITGDTVPPQLMMADLIHPNRYGTRAIAQAVLARMVDLGWVLDAPTTVPTAAAANLYHSPGYEYASLAVGGSVPTYANVYRTPDAARPFQIPRSRFGLRTRFHTTTTGTVSWNKIIAGSMTVAKSQSLWVRPSKACVIKARVEGYTSVSGFVVGDYGQSNIACPANVWTKVASPSTVTGASVAELRVFIESTTIFDPGDVVDFDDYSIISGTVAP